MNGALGRSGFKTSAAVSVDSRARAKQRSEPGVSYLVLRRAAGINPSDSESCGSGVFGRESATQATVSAISAGANAPTDRTEQHSEDGNDDELPGVDLGRRWECPACGNLSEDCYRCDDPACGHDLATDDSSAGRVGGNR